MKKKIGVFIIGFIITCVICKIGTSANTPKQNIQQPQQIQQINKPVNIEKTLNNTEDEGKNMENLHKEMTKDFQKNYQSTKQNVDSDFDRIKKEFQDRKNKDLIQKLDDTEDKIVNKIKNKNK